MSAFGGKADIGPDALGCLAWLHSPGFGSPDLKTLQAELDEARREVDNLADLMEQRSHF
jgi:hypothetical protein